MDYARPSRVSRKNPGVAQSAAQVQRRCCFCNTIAFGFGAIGYRRRCVRIVPFKDSACQRGLELKRAAAVVSKYRAVVTTNRNCFMLTPKRQYFHIHPDGRRVFELGLTAEELAFVGASDRESLAMIDHLRTQNPERWPADWLRYRGLDEAAEMWLSY